MTRVPLVLAIVAAEVVVALSGAAVNITRTNYLGWQNSYSLRNSEVEAIVVPSIGRVMQFRFLGEPGVFWENPALQGQSASDSLNDWSTTEWKNFGGDKAWPSPESNWSEWTKRPSWRPPPGFDGSSYQARTSGDAIVITSPEDSFLGIQVARRIELVGNTGLRITTEFTKRSGAPVKCGVWVVTQLNEPVRLFAPVRPKTIFTRGYILISPKSPPSLKVEGGYIALERAHDTSYKIGLDSERLVWMGEKQGLVIETPRLARSGYPDRECNAEIYTNPDPLKYIELETLGPMKELRPGDKIRESVNYQLFRRRHSTAEEEMKSGLPPPAK